MSHHLKQSIMRTSSSLLSNYLVPGVLGAMLLAILYGMWEEARIRTNVGIVRNRFAQIEAGLQAYFVDHAAYPQCNQRGTAYAYGDSLVTIPDAVTPILERMTTPIAYVTATQLTDPFEWISRKAGLDALQLATAAPIDFPLGATETTMRSFGYQAWRAEGFGGVIIGSFDSERLTPRQWSLQSVGPDNTVLGIGSCLRNDTLMDGPILLIYDPTNGAVSDGSIFKFGGIIDPYVPSYAAGQGLRSALDLNPNGPAEPADSSGVRGFDQYE